MTELSDSDIEYAFAFRRVVQHVKDKKLSPGEIVRRIEGEDDKTEE